MVSCALSGTTAYCFEPFCLENHTLDGRGDCARVCVIQALRTSSVTVDQLGSGGPVGPADVRLGVAHHSESKRHVLPSGLLSLLGHANLVALNMADVRIQGWGWGGGVGGTRPGRASSNRSLSEHRKLREHPGFLLFSLPAHVASSLCFMLF